ncbi:MAG TPA: TMEM175 family protein, partial [Chitinophagaceae bacterium]|nr:TMEM175 family protein [Chitinophagaceae bacterium]
MSKGRLEAFSDAFLAIIITIMILELKVPHGDKLEDLKPLLPVFLSYVLSFIYIAIYWNNHHHMMQAVKQVNGPVLWTNIHLLFWLSMVPAVTGWMGENNFTTWPVALYGFILFMAGLAYYFLAHCLAELHG